MRYLNNKQYLNEKKEDTITTKETYCTSISDINLIVHCSLGRSNSVIFVNYWCSYVAEIENKKKL